MSVEKNVSPTAVASGGGGRWLEKEKKRGKKEEERKKNDVNRDEKEKESKRDSLWLCVLFYRQSTVARSLSLARFSKISFFFRGLIRHWYVLIVTCAKFWWSFTPFFLSFFFFFLLESVWMLCLYWKKLRCWYLLGFDFSSGKMCVRRDFFEQKYLTFYKSRTFFSLR